MSPHCWVCALPWENLIVALTVLYAIHPILFGTHKEINQ